MITLLVCVAGGFGAAARFVVEGAGRARYVAAFPWPTVLVNVTGSLLLGFLTGLVMFQDQPSRLLVILGAGFCGGYTTFSGATFESVSLARQRRLALAVANAVGTLVLTVGAGGLGLFLAHL